MDYNQIKDFLEKFKKTLFQKEETNRIVLEIIKKYTSLSFEPKQVKIKQPFIFIDGTPIVKNEIFIYKKQILLELKKEIPNINFIDIK
jgi:hypothetical protein